MKKFVSLILVFAMLITAFPLTCFAEEIEADEYEDLASVACAAFPEYADRIRNNNNNTRSISAYNADETPEIVTSETRMVSSTQTVSYTEYSDGSILLSDARVTDQFTESYTVDNSSTALNITIYTVTLRAGYTATGDYVKVSNLVYKVRSSGYDSITNTGTYSASSSYCYIIDIDSYTATETASAPAQVVYNVYFRLDDVSTHFYTSHLTFTVRNDTASIDHSLYL